MNPEMIEAGSKPRLEDTTGPKGSADMPEPIILDPLPAGAR